jgi:hypothetical protein
LVKRLIREETWHEYVTPINTIERFETFATFVTHPWGLDASLILLQRICAEDLEALDALDLVTTVGRGGAKNPEGHNQHALAHAEPEISTDLFSVPQDELVNNNNVMNDQVVTTQGNARQYALRRLRKDRGDIHARVLAGELSPHQGMIEAGFRHQPTPLDYLHRYWRQVSAAP